MKKIDYNPNSLSHHNENIQYWVTQGIVIDGERYSVEELFVRGQSLYGVISKDKINFYEYPLATNVSQDKFDPSGILNRLDRLESIPQYKYDDTGVNQRLDSIKEDFDSSKTKIEQRVTLLENKPDSDNQTLSISGNDLSISGGNTIKIPQPDLRVLDNFTTKEYVDTLVKSSKYDPEPVLNRLQLLESKQDKDTIYDDSDLKNRISALENKHDKDTVYDDSALKARVTSLEAKEDSDKQTLTLTGNELSISNGNSVTLPVSVAKDFVVSSDTEGVVVNKTEVDNTITYNVNMNTALDNYYKKAETYTKDEVNKLLNNQEEKATDITLYKGKFTDRNFVREGDYDTAISPRITLTYSKSTGVGILKIDFVIVKNVVKGQVIATLSNDSPVPAELVESQVWIGNVNTSVWVNKNDRTIRISRTTDPSIFNKRIILNIPGIFKLTN